MKALLLNPGRERISAPWLKRWLSALSRQLAKRGHSGLGRRELVVVLVHTKEMKRLNHLYRGKNYATDILSFESADPRTVGELVLCLPTIRSQSKRTGLSVSGELGYMLVHGVLHLLGYDHGDAKSEAVMFALQDELYQKLEKAVGLR